MCRSSCGVPRLAETPAEVVPVAFVLLLAAPVAENEETVAAELAANLHPHVNRQGVRIYRSSTCNSKQLGLAYPVPVAAAAAPAFPKAKPPLLLAPLAAPNPIPAEVAAVVAAAGAFAALKENPLEVPLAAALVKLVLRPADVDVLAAAEDAEDAAAAPAPAPNENPDDDAAGPAGWDDPEFLPKENEEAVLDGPWALPLPKENVEEGAAGAAPVAAGAAAAPPLVAAGAAAALKPAPVLLVPATEEKPRLLEEAPPTTKRWWVGSSMLMWESRGQITDRQTTMPSESGHGIHNAHLPNEKPPLKLKPDMLVQEEMNLGNRTT